MKNWNRIGKIKAVLLVLFSIPNLIFPAQPNIQFGILISILFPLLFGSLVVPFITKINSTLWGGQLLKPNWNDHPLKPTRLLAFNQFAGFFFISVGGSIILGTLIKFQSLNLAGLMSISFGIGFLLGIRLSLKMQG